MKFSFDELNNLFHKKNYTELLFDKMEKQDDINCRVSNLNKRPINPSCIEDFSPPIFQPVSLDSFVFCIKDLVKDLFEERKTSKEKDEWGNIIVKKTPRRPLVILDDYNRYFSKDEDYLSFVLPEKYLKEIVSVDILPNDYLEFLSKSKRLNKITNLILSIFRRYRTQFVNEIRTHIIDNLKSADFSNPCLIPYLYTIGNYIIVPDKTSSESNANFMKALEKHNHEDISLIIANFFISAILGLYSINFTKTVSKDDPKQITRKVYLLNDYGMRFIWTTDPITASYEILKKIQYYYQCGQYKDVYTQLCTWLSDNKNKAGNSELSLAYQLIGACMYNHPKECQIADQSESEIKENGISYILECLATNEAPLEVYYQLYKCYMDSNCKTYDSKKALNYLKEAFLRNNVEAIIKVAEILLTGTVENSLGITNATLVNKLTDVISSAEQYSNTEVGKCLYYRGLIMKSNGESDKSEKDFVNAAKKGHEKAKQQISRKARASQMALPTFLSKNSTKHCFANALSGNNLLTLTTFPSDEWEVFSTEKEVHSHMGVKQIRNIDEFLERINFNTPAASEQRAVILFMSEDESKNLNDCLLLLDKLFNISLDADEAQRHNLTDALDIYVQATFETASMLIDASLSEMGDIYFKVHIEDTEKEAAHQLLCDAPMFIPYLDRSRKENSANIVLLGSTNTNYNIIKETIACAYMGKEYPVSVTMLGDKADYYSARLCRECPGLFEKKHVSCIEPTFINCDISQLDFPSYIYGYAFQNQSDDPIINTLKAGNYFVVDLGDDLRSIQFAAELRTWLLRCGGSFNRAPFIAVKCSDARSAYLSEHLTVSGRAPGNTYFSRYNLFAFGIAKQIYAYKKMIEDGILEKIALNVHRSYCENMSERQIENEFYSYSYNLDSSVCTAIGLSYRMFAANVHFEDVLDYRDSGVFYPSELYAEYSNKTDDIIEIAAATEQSRWNGYVLSRGWMPADENIVAAYKEQSTGSSHRHLLAKYHPFILEWDEIADDKIRKVLGILKSKFDYNKSPQEITRKSIRDTAKFVELAHSKPKSKER